jgi:serine/threonine protein kinase
MNIKLADKYQITETLSQNSNEAVFSGFDKNSNQDCLLKQVIFLDVAVAQQMQKQFQTELQRLSDLSHLQVHGGINDLFWDSNSLWIEYSEKKELSYQDKVISDGPLNEEQIKQFLKQILPVLVHLHEKDICHNNIAPKNILVGQEYSIPVLTNFGLIEEIQSHASKSKNMDRLWSQICSLPLDFLPGGAERDLYALGVTATILLTGKSLDEIFDPLSRSLDWEQWTVASNQLTQIIDRLLCKPPENRFKSATEALDALDGSYQTFPIQLSAQVPFAELSPSIATPMTQDPTGYAHAPTHKYMSGIDHSSQVATFLSTWKYPLIAALGGVATLIMVLSAVHLSSTQPTISSESSNSVNLEDHSLNITSLTEAEAVRLIRNWADAKRQIFAPPFDRDLAGQYLTGKVLHNNVKPGGSIDWLNENNAYYTYGVQEIEPAGKFSSVDDQASIDVQVREQRTLYINGKIDRENTKLDVSTVRYQLIKEGGSWKVSDYSDVYSDVN